MEILGTSTAGVQAESEAPDATQVYDYIVVGSGAGGGPLSANLARAGYRVLLLEAGEDHGDKLTYQVPAFHGLSTEDPDMAWCYFVRHYANDEQQRRDSKFDVERNGVLYPRAGTLGGCTAHNAMITVYPHNSDWDGIAAVTGDCSWGSVQMRAYFERLECCQYSERPAAGADNPSRHGFDGWLTTNEADPKLAVTDTELIAILKAAVFETLLKEIHSPLELLRGVLDDLAAFLRHPSDPVGALVRHLDPNDWQVAERSSQGLVSIPLATRDGKRQGPREFIRQVEQQHPDKLIIQTRALVNRVLFDDQNTAIGVEYEIGSHLYRADPRAKDAASSGEGAEEQPAEKRRAFAAREVILSAGAFNTPQLLMLSGIGPREELERLGIPVRVELPGVGKNLQDRYEVGVISELDADFSLFGDGTFAPPEPGQEPDSALRQWMENGTGVYSTNGAVIGIVLRSKQADDAPDLFVFGLPSYFKGYFQHYSEELEKTKNHFTWAVLKAHTRNTAGTVTLRSSDPRDTPEINFRYFEEGTDAEADLDAVAEGVEFVRRINRRIGRMKEAEMLPGGTLDTPEEIRTFIRNEAWGHHASCTCKIGAADDPFAVLDSRFRVLHTRNLRVVDASVFPRIPGFFIVSAVYMISEKAFDVITEDAHTVA